MCTDIFIGTHSSDADLTILESESGLRICPVPADNTQVRELMELDSIYSVGSFMGCSCGLMFGQWSKKDPDEKHQQRIDNVAHLKEVLAKHFDDIVRIATFETWNFVGLEEIPRRILDLDSMHLSVTEFDLDNDHVYEIWPPGRLGPHSVETIFPPRELTREDITGGVPDIIECYNAFVGKAWNQVEFSTFNWLDDFFLIMDVESLSRVLPAALMACMHDPCSGLHSGLEFFWQREKFVELYGLLNKDQKFFLITMCDFLIRNEDVCEETEAGYFKMREQCLRVSK